MHEIEQKKCASVQVCGAFRISNENQSVKVLIFCTLLHCPVLFAFFGQKVQSVRKCAKSVRG